MSTTAIQKSPRVKTVPLPTPTVPTLTIRLGAQRKPVSEQEFAQICAQNPDLRVELSKEGDLIFMSPVVLDGGNRNFKLITRFGMWTENNAHLGEGFDSSTCFTLPNGAKRSPDVSWLSKAHWDGLSSEQRHTFANICPDFAVELRSKTDRFKTLQNKLKEYMANGTQLSWLIDPLQRKVHIYRPNQAVEILDQPQQLSGEPLLPGFVLRLAGILD